MKRLSALGVALSAAALLLVLMPASAPAASRARADTLLPTKFGLAPAAKEGRAYSTSIAAAATGGVKPYHCARAGSFGPLWAWLHVSSNCVISGTAPLLPAGTTKRLADLKFKLTDSAKPAKTVAFSIGFVIFAATPTKPTAPAADPQQPPDGFQLLASDKGNDADGWSADASPSAFVDNLVGIDIRVSGAGTVSTEIDLFCVNAPDSTQIFKGFGLFTVQIPSGASGCAFTVFGTGAGPGTFTVQVYAQTSGTTPAPTPTPSPSTYPYDGTWTGQLTFTVTTTAGPGLVGPGSTTNVTVPLTMRVSEGVVQWLSDDKYSAGYWYFIDSLTGEPTIPANGLLTSIKACDGAEGGSNGVGFSFAGNSSTFSLQFAGTKATNTAPISCQGSNDPGRNTIDAKFSDGEITLTRTGS